VCKIPNGFFIEITAVMAVIACKLKRDFPFSGKQKPVIPYTGNDGLVY
jgi:hypothetical protein